MKRDWLDLRRALALWRLKCWRGAEEFAARRAVRAGIAALRFEDAGWRLVATMRMDHDGDGARWAPLFAHEWFAIAAGEERYVNIYANGRAGNPCGDEWGADVVARQCAGIQRRVLRVRVTFKRDVGPLVGMKVLSGKPGQVVVLDDPVLPVVQL